MNLKNYPMNRRFGIPGFAPTRLCLLISVHCEAFTVNLQAKTLLRRNGGLKRLSVSAGVNALLGWMKSSLPLRYTNPRNSLDFQTYFLRFTLV
jgi:hypothetical protein